MSPSRLSLETARHGDAADDGRTLLQWIHEHQQQFEHVCRRVELEKVRGDRLEEQNSILRSKLGLPSASPPSWSSRGIKMAPDLSTIKMREQRAVIDQEVSFLQKRVHDLEAMTSRATHTAEKEVVYLVDNSELHANSSGLGYRGSMNLHDKVKKGYGEHEVTEIAPWGTHITGIPEGRNWVRVGRFFLPSVVDGAAVLIPVGWHLGPASAPEPAQAIADSAKCWQLQAALDRQTAETEHEHKLRCELEHKLSISKQKRRRLEEMINSLHSKLAALESHGGAPTSMLPGELNSGVGSDDAIEIEEAWPPGVAERPLHRMRKADLVHDLALETNTSRAALERCNIQRLRILAKEMRSKRQKVLLARQLFSATYEGMRQKADGKQRSKFSAAPHAKQDPHSASATVAVFRVTESHRYEKPGTKGFNSYKAGSEFLLDTEAVDAEIRSKVQALAPGACVRLVLQHDMVVKDGQETEEHVVTYLRESENKASRLLARQSFSAVFENTRSHTSHRHDGEGGHPNTLALFRVQQSHAYENSGGISFAALLPGQEFRLGIETASALVQEKLQSLRRGDLVRITYQQEYVDNPITHSGHVTQAVTAFDIVTGGIGSSADGPSAATASPEPASHGGSTKPSHHSSGGSMASRRAAPVVKTSAQDTRPIEMLKKAELVSALWQVSDMPREALEKCSVQRLRLLLRESRERHAKGAEALGGLGPAWTRGELERPADSSDMGTWTKAVYSVEQQQRLGVDETGQYRGAGLAPQMAPDAAGWTGQMSPLIAGNDSSLGDVDSRRYEFGHQIEEPEGLRDLGYRSERVYTTEQQDRLGVDEIGRPLPVAPLAYNLHPEGHATSSPSAAGALQEWMQEQEAQVASPQSNTASLSSPSRTASKRPRVSQPHADHGEAFFHDVATNNLPLVLSKLEDDAHGGLFRILDAQQCTIFHAAVQHGHAEVLKCLVDSVQRRLKQQIYIHNLQGEMLKQSARKMVDRPNALGRSPLAELLGQQEPREEVAIKLLMAGANPSSQDNKGVTPFHLCAQSGHLRLAKEILRATRGGVMTITDHMGRTPLHAAAAAGKSDIVSLLLNAKANQEEIDIHEHSPADLAQAAGHSEVVRLLLPEAAGPFTVPPAGPQSDLPAGDWEAAEQQSPQEPPSMSTHG